MEGAAELKDLRDGCIDNKKSKMRKEAYWKMVVDVMVDMMRADTKTADTKTVGTKMVDMTDHNEVACQEPAVEAVVVWATVVWLDSDSYRYHGVVDVYDNYY